MLKIEHLTKTYGEKRAVDDLSLHIRPGEIYGTSPSSSSWMSPSWGLTPRRPIC